jgi:uncharacterized RDD family membrane protein YckC
MKTSTLQIRTPEGVVFSQWLAGPVTRLLAWLVDASVIIALVLAMGFVLGTLSLLSLDLARAASAIGYFVISIGYGIACEWLWRGQTVGKRLFRLRVVDAEGLRLQFNQVLTRNLLRFVDALPLLYFVGGVACWLSPRCQRLGDLAANTVVLRLPRGGEPDLDQILASKYNSLRQHPHLAARLRQRVSPAEAAIALQAVLRRDEFEAAARVQLFARVADHFRAKAEFPAEATEGVADEQFLRNVVDVIYRTRAQAATPAEKPQASQP